MCCRWNFHRSVLIPRNLPCPKKSLVVPRYIYCQWCKRTPQGFCREWCFDRITSWNFTKRRLVCIGLCKIEGFCKFSSTCSNNALLFVMTISKVGKTQNHELKPFNANILIFRNQLIPFHCKPIGWWKYFSQID